MRSTARDGRLSPLSRRAFDCIDTLPYERHRAYDSPLLLVSPGGNRSRIQGDTASSAVGLIVCSIR